MKVFCFFISFVFVHVATDELMDYKREVFITNAHIELAYNMKKITVGNKVIANGLEHVITKIVDIEDHDMLRDLDLQRAEVVLMSIMIAVPEYYAYLYDLDEAIYIQRAMQDEISSKLGIAVPEVTDQIFEKLVLTQLGEDRRRFTGKALKDMMNNAITNYGNLTGHVEERRINPTKALIRKMVRSVYSRKQDDPLLWMCRLIALFMSTKFPTSFIKNIKTGDKKTCFLEDEITASKTYREINGVWWQVNVNDIEDKLQLLKEQL
ncbi:uncharacterized protein LOC126847455 [Adelges cooleyi]|uniref:uncharacterized protein LOC126847455 n=1 Tax=Adelges cooleyi TaxID=133065 RepID=UPI00217FC58C|nr:uncharacterized protein LOC126847455 [Adelges cooleyi]